MDTFDVNLLSQVKALDQKMSISQEQLHLKRKGFTEEKGKGKYLRGKLQKNSHQHEGETEGTSIPKQKETTIDIIV